MPTARLAAPLVTLGLLVAGCGGESETGPTATPSSSVDSSPPSTASPSPTAVPLPRAPDRESLPTLMRATLKPGRIVRERTIAVTDAYTRYAVRYGSGDLRISGVLLVPRGRGPFPAVVLNHGYIEPSAYTSGQGLAREQDYLARAGFVVLHTDYRGHAGSDPASGLDRETRLGYTRDTLNAVYAVKRERYVDRDRVAMLGRSMGGGVTLNAIVAKPRIVRAAVLYAPVSSRFRDNFERWTRPERPTEAAAFERRFGRPGARPGVWAGLSARTYFDRIDVPVLIHHGTADESCPIRWSRATQRLLRAAGVDSRLLVYPGEQHAFVPQWERSMERTVRFLRTRMR